MLDDLWQFVRVHARRRREEADRGHDDSRQFVELRGNLPVASSRPGVAAPSTVTAGSSTVEHVLRLKAITPVDAGLPGVEPTKEYRKEYTFRQDWFSHNIPTWAKALEEFEGRPNLTYLEIGVYEGRSLLWMLENVLTQPSSRAICIDRFVDQDWVPGSRGFKDTFFRNVELSGARERVEIRDGYSHIELRKLAVDSVDIIYIDGSHAPADVLEDAILSFRLLTVGGILIFDDYPWTGMQGVDALPERLDGGPKAAIDVFYSFFWRDLDVVHAAYQVIFRKRDGGDSS